MNKDNYQPSTLTMLSELRVIDLFIAVMARSKPSLKNKSFNSRNRERRNSYQRTFKLRKKYGEDLFNSLMECIDEEQVLDLVAAIDMQTRAYNYKYLTGIDPGKVFNYRSDRLPGVGPVTEAKINKLEQIKDDSFIDLEDDLNI